jgi:hypothetical protein
MKPSAGVIAMGEGADVGVGKKTSRKRAVGTREHIVAYLAEARELFDANGMASTQLAAAVGYPGSSVAFAQLLSGMERSGLIEREVRGKRTYRISLGAAQTRGAVEAEGAAGSARIAGVLGTGGADAGARGSGGSGGSAGIAEVHGANGANGSGTAVFDYDELARRLLVQVVRRLAVTEAGAERADPSVLQETVTGLEYELASAWTKHGKLAEENVRLREQLKAAQHSLALARERVGKLPASTNLDSSEVVLLQQLLSPVGSGSSVGSVGSGSSVGSVGSGSSSGSVGSGGDAEGLEDARSLLR